MMKALLFSLALLIAAPLAMAQDIKMRDSLYYTWDDGVMSPEEMQMEANEVFRLCNTNVSQKNLFNCECLAGAFLMEREKLGPTVPQHYILSDITLARPVACANTEMVAGDSYTACMTQAAPLRFLAKDNEEYCECVSNKVARDFTKSPLMSPSYVRELTYDSLLYCDAPENRPKKTATKSVN